MTDTKAIEYTTKNLETVKAMYSKSCFKGRAYICGALLMNRAAKNGGAKGLLQYWEKRKTIGA